MFVFVVLQKLGTFEVLAAMLAFQSLFHRRMFVAFVHDKSVLPRENFATMLTKEEWLRIGRAKPVSLYVGIQATFGGKIFTTSQA